MTKRESFTCTSCGGEFTRNPSSHRKYCNSCNKQASKQRTKNRKAERKFKRSNERYQQYNKLEDPAYLGSRDPSIKLGWIPPYHPVYS